MPQRWRSSTTWLHREILPLKSTELVHMLHLTPTAPPAGSGPTSPHRAEPPRLQPCNQVFSLGSTRLAPAWSLGYSVPGRINCSLGVSAIRLVGMALNSLGSLGHTNPSRWQFMEGIPMHLWKLWNQRSNVSRTVQWWGKYQLGQFEYCLSLCT